jgi:hypothetical protein
MDTAVKLLISRKAENILTKLATVKFLKLSSISQETAVRTDGVPGAKAYSA